MDAHALMACASDPEAPRFAARAGEEVAASAAYPLMLPPLFEKFTFVRGGQRTQDSVVLPLDEALLHIRILRPSSEPVARSPIVDQAFI
jgi:hypothetical protein